MKKYLFIFLVLSTAIVNAQRQIEVGANATCDFPVSTFKFKLGESLAENGGAAKYGWGCDIFVLHHVTKHFFYGLSCSYEKYNTSFSGLDYGINHFIQNSSSPSNYHTTLPYEYYPVSKNWNIGVINIPIGINFNIKHFLFQIDCRAGLMIVAAPEIDIVEDSSTSPNQFRYIRTMDRFSAKPNVLFEYGCDIKLGYEVYKHLNVFTGFTYSGTTNAHVSYFDNPSYGYKKTIQTVGVTLGISYNLPLKNKRT